MHDSFTDTLDKLAGLSQFSLVQSLRRGIEKEALRITPEGYMAGTIHPDSLGAKLTHPNITTDYSESLLELITPAVESIAEVLDWLTKLHSWIYRNIGDEILWAASMPCHLTSEADIPIANYGSSNIGQMKTIYREGLAHRYGKNMQTIAGLHYNVSLDETFWSHYQEICQDKRKAQTFINDKMMGLVRNFIRYEPLIIYLFGASPAACNSFDPDNKLALESLTNKTLYGPYATSLRMSDIGYQNDAQSTLKVSYNSLDEYIHDLHYATSTPVELYTKIGVKEGSHYKQLSDCILQIEAEYYGPIRPKRNAKSCERPIKALKDRGIEYVEIRALDINPYAANGIDANQAHFLECFILFCLLQDSAPLAAEELATLKKNHNQVTLNGRHKHFMLQTAEGDVPFTEWANAIWNALEGIADLLGASYQKALQAIKPCINNPEQLHSAKTLAAIKNDYDACYYEFGRAKSIEHRTLFIEYNLDADFIETQKQLAIQSIDEQVALEANDALSLDEQIKAYYDM